MTKGSTVLRGGKLTFYLNGGRSPRETAAIYAHEFAHAADVKLKLSGRQDWDEDRRTDKEYIAKTAAHTTDDPRGLRRFRRGGLAQRARSQNRGPSELGPMAGLGACMIGIGRRQLDLAGILGRQLKQIVPNGAVGTGIGLVRHRPRKKRHYPVPLRFVFAIHT